MPLLPLFEIRVQNKSPFRRGQRPSRVAIGGPSDRSVDDQSEYSDVRSELDPRLNRNRAESVTSTATSTVCMLNLAENCPNLEIPKMTDLIL